MTQEDRDELRQEMLEDALIETRMRYDLDFAVEQLDLWEAMEAVEELVKKLNDYGHEINVSDLVRDYY